MGHAFSPRTPEAEAGGSVSSRPAWSTNQVPGQPGLLHREILSPKPKRKREGEGRRRGGGGGGEIIRSLRVEEIILLQNYFKFLVRVFIAMMKHRDQKKTGAKRFICCIFPLCSPSLNEIRAEIQAALGPIGNSY